MKRLAILFLSVLVLFCGCDVTGTSKSALPPMFCATAQIEFDDMVYEAVVERYADSQWRVEFLAPDAVKGLIFTVEGDEIEISFNGLHFTFDTEKFPVGSVVSMLTKSIDRIVPTELSVVEGETTDFASGEIDGMSFALTLDKNGIPLTLELGDSGMKITFAEFEIITVGE
ncbi:MAG: hypothetical protein IJ424_05265 [Oscillospiraceae bacterium]|nr:hypothetical protein [Oscillospiraceae bacterium]